MASKITYFLEYFKYLRNPISCLLFKFGLKKEVIVKFKCCTNELKLSDISSLNKVMILVRHEYFEEYFKEYISENEIITVKNGIRIYNPRLYPLNEIFSEYYEDYYSNFDINYENRIIIDIGANSGDSALFFASKGAKIYGFEPVKEYYEIAKKNIELNDSLKNNIKIFNYGVSYKKGTLSIDSMDSVSSYINDNDSYEIEVVSIEEILNHVSPDLLKMDCEGCEFEIIENCDLSMFNEILFEYHSELVGKDYHILVEKLKQEGFTIEFSSVFNRNVNDYGLIHAYK